MKKTELEERKKMHEDSDVIQKKQREKDAAKKPQGKAKEQYDEESRQAIKSVFEKFDKDGSGDIEFSEVANLASELGFKCSREEILQIFKDLDIDGDNKISFEEFWAWWASGKPNKLEKLVYFKLKGMKILKKAHTEFSRIGSLLEDKYEKKKVDTHYVALNYGSHKGEVQLHLTINLQTELNKEIRKKSLEGSKSKDDAESALGFVVRMKSQEAKKGRKLLQKLLSDGKRIIGLLYGPEVAAVMEPFEVEVSETGKEIVLFVNFKRSSLEMLLQNSVFQIFQQVGEKANAKLDIHFGIKNSLNQILLNPTLSFIDWLIEGFLFEAKFSMNKDLFKTVRSLAMQFILMQVTDDEKGNEQLALMSILTLLSSSKIHLTFKDMDNIKEFLDGLGLTNLKEKAPTCLELLRELLEDFSLDHLIKEDSPRPIVRDLLHFLTKYVEGSDFHIYFLLDLIVAEAQVSVTGLGDILLKLFSSPS